MTGMPAGFSIDPTGHHRIDFAGRPRVLTIAFALLWLSGWILMLILTFVDYQRWGTPGLGLLVLATGPPVALALLWVACGKRESLLVTPGEISIVRSAGPIRLSRQLEPAAIRGLRADAAPEGALFDLISDPMAVRQNYVFSYREKRMAVVSPARMDRGCMGVFPADKGGLTRGSAKWWEEHRDSCTLVSTYPIRPTCSTATSKDRRSSMR